MPHIVIIGGGPSGIACALTLDAARRHPQLPQGLQVTVVDSGSSDLLAAQLWEVPGIPFGSNGSAILQEMRSQMARTSVVWREDHVSQVMDKGGFYLLTGLSGAEWTADFVVVATGFKHFDVAFTPEVKVGPHPNSSKARTCLTTDSRGQVLPRCYAAGTVSGIHSMFAIAIGSGTEAACKILGDLAGYPVYVHDVPLSHG